MLHTNITRAVAPILRDLITSNSVLTFVVIALSVVYLNHVWQCLVAWKKNVLYTKDADSQNPISQETEINALGNTSDRGLAAYSWARQHGRFKHTALRQDPFADAPRPAYSLVNLDLPLPPLESQEERAGLKELSMRVTDLKAPGERTDLATLLRFLRARKGKADAAEAYLREALRYRAEMDIHRMETHWDLKAYDGCFAPWWVRGGIIGHSLEGGIVGFEKFGACCFPQLLQQLPFAALQKLDAMHMVRTLAAFEEDSMRRRVPLGNAILILDMDGLGFEDCKPSVARAYGKLVKYRDMLMPNTLKHVLLIRAPRVFSVAWSMTKNFLDPVTRDKVEVVSGDAKSLAMLRKYISDDIIPAYLGGKLCIDGDPECGKFLGASATDRVPQDAIDHLLELVHNSDEKSLLQTRNGSDLLAEEVGCFSACCGSRREK